MSERESYGKELILDLAECDPATFNRASIRRFCEELCRQIDMEPADLHFWDDVGVPEDEQQTEPHLKGTSAVQFITTSNITIHTLDILRTVYVNLFSCKAFDESVAISLAAGWFKGTVIQSHVVRRLR